MSVSEKAEKEPVKKDEKKENDGAPKEEELSEEELALKQNIDLLVERSMDADAELAATALTSLKAEIRASTATMTSVPKPLRFLRPRMDDLESHYNSLARDQKHAKLLADVLSCISMTFTEDEERKILKYRLLGSDENVSEWGHEYVRSLSGQVGREHVARVAAEKDVADLLALVDQIVPFFFQHHSEPEACDLLLEINHAERIPEFADEHNYNRICLYLLSCSRYLPEPEDSRVLRFACDIYRKSGDKPNALRVAIRLNDRDLISEIYLSADGSLRKQLAFMLGREDIPIEAEEDDELINILSNGKLTGMFKSLARDLEVMEPKLPEDIYKTHLQNGPRDADFDSARLNLASSLVNAFLNAGFGKDKLMMEDGNWLFKNKDHGQMATAASIGMLMLWDVDNGLTEIDKYLYSEEDNIKAGALLAIGLVNCGVRSEMDPALALLSEHISSDKSVMRLAAIIGLGLAYANSQRSDVLDELAPIIADSDLVVELSAFAALSAGLIFVGSSNEDAVQSILAALLERNPKSLSESTARFFALGLGLLYLGKQDAAEATLEVIKTLEGPMGKYCEVTVEACAYAGSGDVLKVQQLLEICGQHPDEDGKEGDKEEESPALDYVTAATLGVAMIASGEELGTEMAPRVLGHVMRYGEPGARRGVPLALALLYISNPGVNVTTTLHRLTHDHDPAVSQAAIVSLGLCAAGTNNSRIASQLRQLSGYFAKDPQYLFLVRLAQGLVHMGKGLVTIDPYRSDRLNYSSVGFAGLLVVLHSLFDPKGLVLGRFPYLMYYLACSMSPRMLMTVDEDLNQVQTTVRVGQAVDTVAQAGRPKTITGFQTHTTPVLLSFGDRAELATEEYLPTCSVLEDVVIVRKNPDYKEKPVEEKKS